MASSNDNPPFQKRTDSIEWIVNQAWTNPYGSSPHRLVIGQREQIEADIDRERAAHARDARANTAEEISLCAAIVAERGGGPAEHPWKEAEAILTPVNQRLKFGGYDSVKVGAVARRLKKFPHS